MQSVTIAVHPKLERALDVESKEILPWIGTLISLGGAAMGYGILREKVSRLEHDLDEHKAISVTFKHFEAVMKPMNDTLRELRDDFKDFLRRESHRRHNGGGDDDEE